MLENLRWGVSRALLLACLLAAYAPIQFAARGAAPFERIDTTVGAMAAISFVSGIAVGCIVGLLRPRLATRRGAMAVGAVAALPVAAAIGWDVAGPFSQWHLYHWLAWLVFSLVIGPVWTSALWAAYHPISGVQDE